MFQATVSEDGQSITIRVGASEFVIHAAEAQDGTPVGMQVIATTGSISVRPRSGNSVAIRAE